MVGTLVLVMEANVVPEDGQFDPAILELAAVTVEQSIVGLLVVAVVAVHLEYHANYPVWIASTVDLELADSNPVAVSAIDVESQLHHRMFSFSILVVNSSPVYPEHV